VIKDKIEFHPVGVIHTSFTKLESMPIQPVGAVDVKGTVEVFEDFRSGLKDLDGFSHIILLYYFHQSQSFNLHVVPFLDSESRGLFATRAPRRPNPIGLSVVQLDKIENGVLYIRNVDILDVSSLMSPNSMCEWKPGLVGLRKPGRIFSTGNRMIDSNRTANNPIQTTR